MSQKQVEIKDKKGKGDGKQGGFKSVVEHTWSWELLTEKFPHSGLDLKALDKSRGLSSSKVEELRKIHGYNRLTPQKEVSKILLFLRQFLDTLMILLEIAGILSLVAYGINTDIEINLICGLVLFGIVVVQCILSFLQELETHKVMAAFKNIMPADCNVIRDGVSQKLPVDQIVPGDIVQVQYGQKIPADMRVVQHFNLKVECASITGESEPVKCSIEVQKEGFPANEAPNLVFSSTSCVEGTGMCLVLRIGDNTIIGEIAKTINSTEVQESSLQREMQAFVNFVAVLSLTVSVITFIIGIIRMSERSGENVLDLFVNGFLIIIVAFVPQGLPATVLSLLTIVGKRLAEINIFVKRLNVIETLGSISLIASDKTGTLTKNQMTVQDIWCENTYQQINEPIPFEQIAKSETGITKLLRVTAVCNTAKIINTVDASKNPFRSGGGSNALSKYSRSFRQSSVFMSKQAPSSIMVRQQNASTLKIEGNASDIAILRYCEGYTSSSRLRKTFPKIFEIPFSSAVKWQLVLAKDTGYQSQYEDKYICMIKGAPERILNMCSTFQEVDGSIHEITEQFRRRFAKANEKFGSQGKRVIGFCERTFFAPKNTEFKPDSEYLVQTGLLFIGLTGIIDPPRDDVPQAIEICKTAGIRVFMVTGDQPVTAQAIARQIGIIQEKEDEEEGANQLRDSQHLQLELGMLMKPKSNLSPDIEKYQDKNYAVVTGMQMEHLTEDDWEELYKKQGIVFARVTPNDKLEIVKRMQNQGIVVAATGDGVNDAQALKQADVGVAMGIMGSEVAKDASDIILMDDNFASIVRGIEQGRLIYDNLKKTIAYTLAHTLPEVIPVLLGIIFGIPPGLSSLQILSIDLFTEIGPAVSLAYETPELDLMYREPRNQKEDKLVAKALIFYAYVVSGVIIFFGCLATYAFVFMSHGISMTDLLTSDDEYFIEDAVPFTKSDGTVLSKSQQLDILYEAAGSFHLTLVIAQFFHVWSCRTRNINIFQHGFDNTTAFYGVFLELCLIIIFVYVPGVQDILGARNPGWIPWVVSVITGIILTLYNEWRKWYFQKRRELDLPPSTFERWFMW